MPYHRVRSLEYTVVPSKKQKDKVFTQVRTSSSPGLASATVAPGASETIVLGLVLCAVTGLSSASNANTLSVSASAIVSENRCNRASDVCEIDLDKLGFGSTMTGGQPHMAETNVGIAIIAEPLWISEQD
ncbi:hypothetical protein M0804_015330 [Polistes exclamans]|nr:hypothetical protein M0804_015330 [Polistes exclamans]